MLRDINMNWFRSRPFSPRTACALTHEIIMSATARWVIINERIVIVIVVHEVWRHRWIWAIVSLWSFYRTLPPQTTRLICVVVYAAAAFISYVPSRIHRNTFVQLLLTHLSGMCVCVRLWSGLLWSDGSRLHNIIITIITLLSSRQSFVHTTTHIMYQ